MRRIKKYIALALTVLSVTSCDMFRDATGEVPSAADTATADRDTDTVLAITDVFADAVTTESTETETPEPELLPMEPDPSVFATLESRLQNPPVAGAKIAFCYEDLTTGITYSYNGDAIMWSASLMKLPVVMSILYKAERADMGLDNTFVYTGKEYAEGTGEIKNRPVGSTYTYIELIDYMLLYSDNVALGEVQRTYGKYAHFDYLHSIGADSFTENGGWSATALDGAKVLRSTYEYIEGDHLYSDRIKDDMINSMHQVMLSPGLSGKDIVRKYGWDTEGYNDMGIVYDEHPYVLVFLSNMISGDWSVNNYISNVAAEADRIHEEIWGTIPG